MPSYLELADWRRRIFELYAEVRRARDPRTAWEGWRRTRHELFVSHAQSPMPEEARASYEGPHTFAYDPDARVLGRLKSMPIESVEIATSDGRADRFLRFGRVDFEIKGTQGELEVYWLDAYGGGIYLAFRDTTSGDSTYGGGRYLLDTVKGADLGEENGSLVLDFNFSYQPSCSYDPRWSCPLPPPSNRLAFPIEAGERLEPRSDP